MKKWWVKLLLAFVVVLLALAILFFNSGSDSKKLLEQYRNQLLATGEKLNLDDYIPPRVDADMNGASFVEEAASSFAPRRTTAIFRHPPLVMNVVAPGKASVEWQGSEVASLFHGKLVTNGWDEVESDLVDQGYALGKLQEAAKYSQFDFATDYRQSPLPLPQLSQLRDAAALLSAKTIFDLHRGDATSAATNLQTLLAIANAGRNEPVGASQIYRVNMIQKALAVQWEWLQATNVTDEELANLQARWTNIDVVGPNEKAMQVTRLMSGQVIDQMRAGPSPFTPQSSAVPGGNPIRGFIESMRQRGGDAFWRESWSYDDELNMMQGYQVMIEMVRQARTNGYFKDALAERERKIAALGLGHSNWLRTRLNSRFKEVGIRPLADSVDRLAATEAWRQCAIAAIALKRYELRHGTLPKDLSGLVPEFLPQVPRDPMDGKPLRYRLNADGTFWLYSIGIDGIDNGGDGSPTPPATSFWWETTRDWVWPQPATPLEVQSYYAHPPK